MDSQNVQGLPSQYNNTFRYEQSCYIVLELLRGKVFKNIPIFLLPNFVYIFSVNASEMLKSSRN